jgi:DegV family protein with EDD domain
MTDSTADLPQDYCDKKGLRVLGMTITVDGVAFETVGENRLTSSDLLQKMETGGQATTSAISSGDFKKAFEEATADGSELLYLAFSSGLSGTYQSALIARDMLREENPGAEIVVLDTLAAASGEGYLVGEAVRLREAGKSLTETVEVLSALTKRLRSWFMVDDLHHLARGGRIPKTTAVLGTLASIKPVLDVDTEGKLRQVAKVRGWKKAVNSLIAESLNSFDEDYPLIIVAHSNALEPANAIKQQFLDAKTTIQVEVRPLGPVIAAHTGAGTLAIFTIGKSERQ